MDSNAESSSAQARTTEEAAIEGSPHTAAADGHLAALNQSSSTPHQPDENRSSNNHKLEQMLQLFQKQLDLQQKQLDLLRRIAGTIDEDEPPTPKALGKQAETVIQPDTSDWDPELVMGWQRLRGPESPDLQRFGNHFFGFCETNSLFWFSPKNEKSIASMIESDKKSEREPMMPAQEVTLAQRLRRHWPQSLGTTGEEGISWTFLKDAGTGLTLLWYSYNDKGDLSLSKNLNVFISRDVVVMDAFARRSKRGGDFIQIFPYSLEIERGPGLRLPLSSVAYTLLQLTQNRPQQEDSFRGPEPIRLSTAEQFLVSYLSEWSTDSARQSSFYFDEMMHTHSIRYFEVTHSPPTELLLSLDGIPVPRETVRLTNSQAYLNERRVSLALFGESRSRLPCFTIIYLADHIHHSFGPNDLITRGYFASIHLFINIITRAIDLSCEVWERVLTELDTELNITITDLFNQDEANQLMFDDKPFHRSKLYFNMLQLSRLFIGCIEETIRELYMAHDKFTDNVPFKLVAAKYRGAKQDLDKLSIDWRKLIDSREPKLNVLLDRLRRKKEEIESLRDGLLNATSVREASRSTELSKISTDLAAISMRQNQYIFVFTVATVVFLPLGFVTSVFGMHLFDTTDPGVVAARPKFYITIFVLSLGTYAVAGLAYWLVRNRKGDGSDGPVPKGVTTQSSSENDTTSEPLFDSDGKEVTSSTSKIPTDSAKSLWDKFAVPRRRKNHSPKNTTENVLV